MIIQNRWDLQEALVEHLTNALAGKGIVTDEGDETDIPVVTDIIDGDAQLFVRLDAFSVLQGGGKAGHIDRHTFMAHVFCVNTASNSDIIVDGAKKVSEIQAAIVSALDGWSPFDGASIIEHISSNDAADEDPSTHHAVSRFKVMI